MKNDLVGRLFADTSTKPIRVYAVGKDGFIDLWSGDYIRFDIEGPMTIEIFKEPVFERVETVDYGY